MIGALLNNRYRVDAEIGQGGMGIVYRGYDTELEREVAIKVLSKTGLGTEGRTQLLSEAQTAAKLNHPNIVTVYDVGEEDSLELSDQVLPFIVMEYMEGNSLHEVRPETLEETLTIMRQVSAGLGHAHGQGIIHRDLKPENVVLTRDGTAKLMDFGLARSVASRYTTEGMVAGTVFYLAPEQALGQEIDPRTDLYSLGVMMYELTTGELPFVDRDPIAVISQHLHAPVVPPRAKNDNISSTLNELILNLMSKDPRDRPASAREVLKILEAPEVGDKDKAQVEELSLLDRIVRGRIVGRERELNQARQLWQNAASGEGQLLLISGEPGIGKTRLMHEIATQAEVSGGQVLVGECQSEGNAPHAPFAQITRRALRNDGLELPKHVLADLLMLSPELSIDYPDVDLNPKLGPEAEQRRLFENVVEFCEIMSQDSPLLLVLEDIHWADSGSLRMLEHLARRTRQQPVMLLGTYREVELDEALPLHETLLGLTRRRLGRRVKLERLNKDTTRVMLGIIFAGEITPDFLEGIYKETEGNPFFVEEISKALVESGQVWYEDGEWQRVPSMEAVIIPQGVKMAIQSRVSKLMEETQGILLTGAVIGREFDYQTLAIVSGKDEDTLIDSLEEGISKQLIEEMRVEGEERFSFSHALISATLRESISGLRRTRLHRQVASAIEELHPEDYERLAYHWGEAGDEERGLEYTIKAAERAKHAYANKDAVRLYSEALALLPEDHAERFDLLAGRAEVYDVIGERESQMADVEIMLRLAEESGDEVRRVDALLALTNLYLNIELAEAGKPAELALSIAKQMEDVGREGLARYCLGQLAFFMDDLHQARDHLQSATASLRQAGMTIETAESLSFLSVTLVHLGEGEAGLKVHQEAVDLSEKTGDKVLAATVKRRLAIAYMAQYQFTEALPVAEEALAMFREVGDFSGEMHARNVLGFIRRNLDMLEEAENDYLAGLRIAESTSSDTGIQLLGTNLAQFYYWYKGEPERSLDFVQDYLDRTDQREHEFLSLILQEWKIYLFSCLGKFEQAYNLYQTILSSFEKLADKRHQALSLSFLGYLSAELGHFSEAHQYLEKAVERCSGLEGGYETNVAFNFANSLVVEGKSSHLQENLKKVKDAVVYTQEHNLIPDSGALLYIVARMHLALLEEDQSHAGAALECSEGAIEAFEKERYVIMPEQYLFLHSHALRANNREEEADEYLRQAHERMMMVAGKINDEDLRRSYLENAWDNREIQAAYKDRLGS